MTHNIKAIVSVARQEVRANSKGKYGDLFEKTEKHLIKAFNVLEKIELNENIDYIEERDKEESK